MSGIIGLFVTLVIFGLIFYACWWFLNYIGLPEPFNKVARVLLALVALIFIINLLLGLAGSPLFGTGHFRF